MKIECPGCKASYSVPDEKVSPGPVNAVCKKCGAKMRIEGASGEVQALSEPSSFPAAPNDQRGASHFGPGGAPGPKPDPREPDLLQGAHRTATGTVASMAPPYPKFRDALIVGCILFILTGVLFAGYMFTQKMETALKPFVRNPAQSIFNLFNDPEIFRTCESFLRRRKDSFEPLGRNLSFSLIRQSISVINGKKTATAVIEVKGSMGSGHVTFRLDKRGDRWRILSAVLDTGKGLEEPL